MLTGLLSASLKLRILLILHLHFSLEEAVSGPNSVFLYSFIHELLLAIMMEVVREIKVHSFVEEDKAE